jgi:hypothetical protein
MKTLLAAMVLVAVVSTTPAAADIVCTHTGGCRETGTTIISNGGAYRGLEYAPRLHKDGKVRKPVIQRYYE